MFEHVLCVYPYRRELNRVGFFPPLGLEAIAAVLQPHSRAIDVVDLRRETGHTKDFLRPETDLVCFSINWDREAEFVRAEVLSVPPGILTVVGGRHATEDPDGWLKSLPNVDVLVRGDGEEAVEELCRGRGLEEIAGISFRRDGRIFHNPNRHLQAVRDDLYPDRRLRRYVYEVEAENIRIPLAIDGITASRGCPFNCRFCSFGLNPWGERRSWSARSPESVVAELAEVDAPVVGFSDDLFTFDMDRVERICDLILARGIRKKYLLNARLEVAKRPEVLRKMERAGFAMLMVGIESAHDKTLRSMRKGFDTAKIREYCQMLRHSSMVIHGYFILGNIGESVEEMSQIAPFARELHLDTIAISVLRHSAYSGLDDLVAQHPNYHIGPNGKIYSDHCSVSELRNLRRRIVREFYTAGQILRICRKGVQNDTLGVIPRLLPHVPAFGWRLAQNPLRRAWRRRSRRRKARRLLEGQMPKLALLRSFGGGPESG